MDRVEATQRPGELPCEVEQLVVELDQIDFVESLRAVRDWYWPWGLTARMTSTRAMAQDDSGERLST